MKQLYSSEKVKIPTGVTVNCKGRVVEVKGPKGTLTKNFKHIPCDISIKDDTITVSMWFSLSKQLAAMRSLVGHLKNMITGVTAMYQYKMRVVYVHFPTKITITNGGKSVEIRRYLGEERTRFIDLVGETKIVVGDLKDEFILTGPCIEDVSRSCALIRQSCLVRNKDMRKFLDGIYVSESGPITAEE